jgi:hypothetical protein
MQVAGVGPGHLLAQGGRAARRIARREVRRLWRIGFLRIIFGIVSPRWYRLGVV